MGEASATGVKVNMLSASLEKAPEATLQTQTGSPQCDPEKVTWRRHQDLLVPVGAEGDEPTEERVRPESLLQIGCAEGEELTPKRDIAHSREGPNAIIEDRPARLGPALTIRRSMLEGEK